jgi:tetratricopeptide (TPR) repeat protein
MTGRPCGVQRVGPVTAWRKPLEAARLADPEAYRDQLRKALLAVDRRREAGALAALAAAPEAAGLPAPTAVLLGRALAESGEAEAAVGLLRPAAFRHSGDVWVNHALAGALDKLPLPPREEAVRYYTAARALRPETAHDLAHLLERLGRGAEAEAVFRDLAKRQPSNARHLMCLAVHAQSDGRAAEAATIFERAVAAAREAIRQKGDDFTAHNTIGFGLSEVKRDYSGAEVEFREEIRLRPDDVQAHTNLGRALKEQGNVSDAIAAFRESIRLQPAAAEAHVYLGSILCDVKRDYTGAEAEFREAIRLAPGEAVTHTNLGNALIGQKKVDDGIAAHRKALRLEPGLSLAHHNLGAALRDQGKVPEAIAEFREAIRLRPDEAIAHGNLGIALRRQGKYVEALAELRAARERAGPDLEKRLPGFGKLLEGAERKAALAARLPALLKGDDRPKDNAERLALAELCYDTKRHAAAVGFWAEALQADPKRSDDLPAGHRYSAACAAALAGCGGGKDDPPLNEPAQAGLRGRALEWLRADLALRRKQLDTDSTLARRALDHWTRDSDLAGVRDRDAIEKLPADERRAWEALWKDVEALLKGVARPEPTASKH